MRAKNQTAKAEPVKNDLEIAISLISRIYDAKAHGLPTPKPEEFDKCGDVKIESSTFQALLLVKKVGDAIIELYQFANNYPGITGFGVTGDGNTNLCEMNKMGDFIIRCSNFLPINVPVLNNDTNNQTTKPC